MLSPPGSVLVPTFLHPEMAVSTDCVHSEGHAGPAVHAGLVGGLCGHGVHVRGRWHAISTIAHIFLPVVPRGITAFILHFLLEFEGGISVGEEGLVASEASSAHVCTLVWGQTEKGFFTWGPN